MSTDPDIDPYNMIWSRVYAHTPMRRFLVSLPSSQTRLGNPTWVFVPTTLCFNNPFSFIQVVLCMQRGVKSDSRTFLVMQARALNLYYALSLTSVCDSFYDNTSALHTCSQCSQHCWVVRLNLSLVPPSLQYTCTHQVFFMLELQCVLVWSKICFLCQVMQRVCDMIHVMKLATFWKIYIEGNFLRRVRFWLFCNNLLE